MLAWLEIHIEDLGKNMLYTIVAVVALTDRASDL